MKLSRTVAYALRASLLLAQDESTGPVPCSRLAKDGNMPERFLLQILRNLVNHGVLESTRGVEGGYRLGRSSKSISLLDIMEAIDGPLVLSISTAEDIPPVALAQLETQLESVLASNREALQKIKLSTLTPQHKRRLPTS